MHRNCLKYVLVEIFQILENLLGKQLNWQLLNIVLMISCRFWIEFHEMITSPSLFVIYLC